MHIKVARPEMTAGWRTAQSHSFCSLWYVMVATAANSKEATGMEKGYSCTSMEMCMTAIFTMMSSTVRGPTSSRPQARSLSVNG